MRLITILAILLWLSQDALAAVKIVFVHGISADAQHRKSEKAAEKIRSILEAAGYINEFGGSQAAIGYFRNPGDGSFNDQVELGEQAVISSAALVAAKASNPGATTQSPSYRLALGKHYTDAIAAGAGDTETKRHVYSVVRDLGRDIQDEVVANDRKLIIVAHSQGNFFAEAVDAYLRYKLDAAGIGKLDRNLRFVGAASVAASVPNNRFVSILEDAALAAHQVTTSDVPDFSMLPRNASVCPVLDTICVAALYIRDRAIHGFREIYTSDLVDLLTGKTLAALLASLINDSRVEIEQVSPPPPPPPSAPIERVSVASDGSQGNSEVWLPSLSASGRYVAFVSFANNLVPGDTNGGPDVFVHDRQTRETTRVSVASDGTQALGAGGFDIKRPSISADGRFISFTSSAYNLVPGDTNGVPDVFVHDRQTRLTTRVSVASDGTQANDRHPFGSRDPSISSDGRYVAFTSTASNLVPDDTGGYDDVFVHDRQSGITSLVSISSTGIQGNLSSLRPSISADGQIVAFESGANNLLGGPPSPVYEWSIFVHDRVSRVTSRVDAPSSGDRAYQNANSFYASISADGRFVAFLSAKTNLVANDTNGADDIFVHDRTTGITSRVSIASGGAQGNSWSDLPTISGDGRFVVFSSVASDLAENDTNGASDVFLHDRQSSLTRRVSVAGDGSEGNNESFGASISTDGRSIAFVSPASNFVAADTNGVRDIFALGSFGP